MGTRTQIRVRTTGGPVNVVHPLSPLASLVGRQAVGIDEGCTLAMAAEAMRAAGTSSLLVGGREGIVTERDLTRALGAGLLPGDPVTAVVTRHPAVVPGSMPVVAAAERMLNEGIRHLVVELPAGRVGVVSMRDLLAVLLAAAQPQLWLASLRVAIEEAPENWLG